MSGFSSNDRHTATVSAQSEIAILDIRVVLQSDRVTFPFHFPSIPLAHFEDMPETLPELTFEGDVPISLEFTGVTEKNNIRTAMFRWTNHTNKDIHQVRVKTEFLDAAGTVIKERDASPSGNRFLLDFGESEETIHVGSGPPEGTVSARATLQSITFVDATEWNVTENQ